MTKKEIAKLVYASCDLSHLQTQEAVQATFDSLLDVLLEFGRVELRGFGVFAIQTRAGRKARNPRSGEEVWVPEHETVAFKPSKVVKDRLEARRAKKAKTKKAAAPKKAAAKSAPKAAPKAAAKKAVAAKPVKKAAKKSTKK